MALIATFQVDGFGVYCNTERAGRSVRFEVYKINNPANVDPLPIYAAFKAIAADLFRAEVTSQRYDPPTGYAADAPVETVEVSDAPQSE